MHILLLFQQQLMINQLIPSIRHPRKIPMTAISHRRSLLSRVSPILRGMTIYPIWRQSSNIHKSNCGFHRVDDLLSNKIPLRIVYVHFVQGCSCFSTMPTSIPLPPSVQKTRQLLDKIMYKWLLTWYLLVSWTDLKCAGAVLRKKTSVLCGSIYLSTHIPQVTRAFRYAVKASRWE